MEKITPFLWFDNQAEEAAKFYVSLFKNSRILNVGRYGVGEPMPKGTARTVEFVLEGKRFIALNGGAAGPGFKFNWAVSFLVNCETQREVDRLWTKLTVNGGQEGQCGWLKDRFGLSWQIVPAVLGRLLGDPDTAKAGRVMQAMLKMNKLDIGALKRAYGTGTAGKKGGKGKRKKSAD